MLLGALQEVRFSRRSREENFDWVEKTLGKDDYASQGLEGKGLLWGYVTEVQKVAGRTGQEPTASDTLSSLQAHPSMS